LVIPGVVTLAQALELMQRENANAGIVVDEYGGTDGLLTLAHLAQVLLGNTVDEQAGGERFKQVDDSSWQIPGNTPIEPWTALLNSPSITDEVATIGGFMSHVSGSIPQTNDRLLFNNILFVVEKTEGKRIKTLLVKKLPAGEARRMTQQGLV
jgi:CBS domain containing-hemolysin-like protein